MKNIESIRHGDRVMGEDGSYGEALSAVGRENAKKKSLDYYKEIKESPEGTVFFMVTSNIERAIDTRSAIEEGIEALIKEEDNIEVILVKDVEKVELAKKNEESKYVVKDSYPNSLLGLGAFKEDNHDLLLFHKLTKKYKNNSVLALKTWITKKDEVDDLKNEIVGEVSDVDIEKIKPSDFNFSPEDFILSYFKFLKRISEIADKHFPGRPWKCLQVGHDVQLDFSAMFLLEGEISLKAFEKIKKLRNFLESSQIDIHDGKMIFKYRDLEKEIEVGFGELIENLKEASKKRKQEWNKNR